MCYPELGSGALFSVFGVNLYVNPVYAVFEKNFVLAIIRI